MAEETAPFSKNSYCLFGTAMGVCGIAWNNLGVIRFQLPEKDQSATEKRLRSRLLNPFLENPKPEIQQLIADIQRYFTGVQTDFSSVVLDLENISMPHRKVYESARKIQWGQTTSYGKLGRQAGFETPGSAREIGVLMSRNPIPIIIPCHRVLAAGKKIGGFSAHGGRFTKERLLSLEGIHIYTEPFLPGLLPHL